MSATNKRGQGIDGSTIALLIAVVAAFAVLGSVWGAVALGSQLEGVNEGRTADPFEVFFGVLRGTVLWPAAATWILAVILAIVVAVAVLVVVAIGRARKRRTAVDAAAVHMGKGKQLRSLSATGARQTAQRLGVQDWVGVLIGITVAGRQKIYASPEDMITLIAGPRVGKSTAYVIPTIADAPGAVLTTSNNRSGGAASLPRRGVRLGAPAILVETVPWMSGPHADELRASIAAHDPSRAVAAPDGSAAVGEQVSRAVEAVRTKADA